MSFLSLAAFARVTGRTKSEVETLLNVGLPSTTTGTGRGSTTKIEIEAALKWLTARALDAPAALPEGVSLEQAKTALALAQARIAELRFKQMSGDLISIDEFMPVVERAVAAARARLLAVPTKLAPIVSPADPVRGQRILEGAMQEVLAELRTMLDGPDLMPPDQAEADAA